VGTPRDIEFMQAMGMGITLHGGPRLGLLYCEL
jgi:hypothetical protein